jgi:peptidyl-prolyl cis-trans isomerase C
MSLPGIADPGKETMASTRILIASAALLAACTLSCAAAVAADQPQAGAGGGGEQPVARVNGVDIVQREFERNWRFFMQRSGIPAGLAEATGKIEEFRKQVLERLVDEELLFQDAKRKNLLVGKDVVDAELAKARAQFATPEAYQEALAKDQLTEELLRSLFGRNLSIQALVEKEIAARITLSDAEVHEFYLANPAAFEMPERVRARHILVEVSETDDAQARQAKRLKAESLLAQLKSGPKFEDLARTDSDCPSAPQGGDLGFFQRGQMVPAFEEAAFSLKPGELSGVVETPFGYHLIRVEERREAGKVPEAEVAPQIREHLQSRKTEAAVQESIKALREGATIELLMKL